jgi:tRNA dimethylallyltransferase
MHTLISVIGPTGSGKTALAEALAVRFHGELVSCDAKQVYRGMDIGTNKDKKVTVAQHLLDIKNPGERITVAEYQALAYQVIDEIITRGKQPILVGGSMLYAEAVMAGYVFEHDKKSTKQQPRYRVLKLAPRVDRAQLKIQLAERTQAWLKAGLLEEIQALLAAGTSPQWLESCGLEYRYLTQHLQGEISLDEAVSKMGISLNQYVKRQYTWWRRHNDIHWVESHNEAVALVEAFLQSAAVL